jgi:hypothetical protein
MRVAENRLDALRMMVAGIIAERRRARAWRWKSRRAALFASKGIRGDMTKAGFGWTTDAGLTSGWSLSGRGRIGEANRLFAALRMTWNAITALRTRAETWN